MLLLTLTTLDLLLSSITVSLLTKMMLLVYDIHVLIVIPKKYEHVFDKQFVSVDRKVDS